MYIAACGRRTVGEDIAHRGLEGNRRGHGRITVSNGAKHSTVSTAYSIKPPWLSAGWRPGPDPAQASCMDGLPLRYPNHGQSSSRAGHALPSGFTCLLWMTKSQLHRPNCRRNCASRSVGQLGPEPIVGATGG